MLRGNHPATVDAKGRLKVPAAFVEELTRQGTQVFVTSLHGDCASIYPLHVWQEIEARMQGRSELDPVRRKFGKITGYYGQESELDGQGRILLPRRLREKAKTVGEVDVLGQGSYLDAWDHETLRGRVEGDPLTDEDLALLAQEGI